MIISTKIKIWYFWLIFAAPLSMIIDFTKPVIPKTPVGGIVFLIVSMFIAYSMSRDSEGMETP